MTITALEESFQFPMKRVGAATSPTISPLGSDAVAEGVAASDISGAADSVADAVAEAVADGVATVSGVAESEDERLITITVKSKIPAIAANKTRGEVDCFGAEDGLTGALFTGGKVVTLTGVGLLPPPTGTGGITKLFTDEDFFRAGAFLATFLTVFLAAAFLRAGAFLAAIFLRAGAFLAIFLATDFFLVGAFLATFFTAAFFLTATIELLLRIRKSRIGKV
jgi:hypothetical protein